MKEITLTPITVDDIQKDFFQAHLNRRGMAGNYLGDGRYGNLRAQALWNCTQAFFEWLTARQRAQMVAYERALQQDYQQAINALQDELDSANDERNEARCCEEKAREAVKQINDLVRPGQALNIEGLRREIKKLVSR